MQAETVNKINLKISIWNKTLSNTGKLVLLRVFVY